MANIEGFDASQVEPTKGFELIPPDEYEACIAKSEEKLTKAGDGHYHSLQFEIQKGEAKGRRLFVNLNLDNPNAQAVAIARAELSAICRAVNVLRPKDTEDLHNIPLMIKVGQRKRKDNGEMENYIKGYSPVGGSAPAPATAQSSSSTPPWKK